MVLDLKVYKKLFMTSLKQLFSDYRSQTKAIPAFNIDAFEIYQAVEAAVIKTNLPCIVQTSPSEDQFLQAERLFLLVKKAQADGLPIYLNYDHGKDVNRLKTLANLGFDMIHFDGSTMDYSTNQAICQDLRSNLPDTLIEVEFNHIDLVNHHALSDNLTSPDQAKEFVANTGADLLAVSIGNLHGVNRTSPELLNLDLLAQIRQALPNTFLTLHGGSGISAPQITSAIKLGVVKININTDLRLAFKSAIKQALINIDSEKIYEYFSPVISDLKSLAVQKLVQFSS